MTEWTDPDWWLLAAWLPIWLALRILAQRGRPQRPPFS